MTAQILITVNGQDRRTGAAATVMSFLEELGLNPARVAVERNREIVPRSRYGVTALAEGWAKFTWALAPTLKLFQSNTARLLDWLMWRLLPLWLMLAVPAATLPPWGNWVAEMAGVCAQLGMQPAAKPAKAQAQVGDQRRLGTLCGSSGGGAFWVMGTRLKKAG